MLCNVKRCGYVMMIYWFVIFGGGGGGGLDWSSDLISFYGIAGIYYLMIYLAYFYYLFSELLRKCGWGWIIAECWLFSVLELPNNLGCLV